MSLQRMSSQQQIQLRTNEPVEAPAPSAGTAPAVLDDSAPFFRLDLKRSLQLHGKLVWGFALAGLAGAIALGAMKWPIYISQAQVYVQPTSTKVLEQSNQQNWPIDANTYDSFVQQQVQSAANPIRCQPLPRSF